MSDELDATYRLVHIASNTDIPVANIIDAVHKCIGTKLSSGNDRIESIRTDETGYVLLIRRPEHADKLVMKGRLFVNSKELSVKSVMPGSRKLVIRNLPLFVTEDDVTKSLLKYGMVRFVKSGFVVDDIRDGLFTACVVFEKKVPKKLSVAANGKKYQGDVYVIGKVEKAESCCVL